MIVQGLNVIIWFFVVPFFLGNLVFGLFHRTKDGVSLQFVIGFIAMMAIFQIVGFVFIVLKQPFHVLYYVLVVLYLILTLSSMVLYGRRLGEMIVQLFGRIRSMTWTMYGAILIVAVQCYYYIFYETENADDAYYVATASVTLFYDDMYLHSPYTGRALQYFNLRYVCSPYPIFQAFLSRATGIAPAVIAHTVLPPVLVIVAYLLYWCMGKLLFEEEKSGSYTQKTQNMCGMFVMLVSWIHITSYYCMKNPGAVLLIRVWQGKGTLAAVILPIIFYLCYRMSKGMKTGDITILCLISTAACLASSMGIVLAPVMMGLFAVLFGLIKRDGRYFMGMVAGSIPCLIMGLLNIGLLKLGLGV